MTTFHVTYPNGKITTTESSDCTTVEQFCNQHFGSTWEAAKANGAKVVIGKQVETKVYPDGAEATGTAPLPEESPAEAKSVVATVKAAVKRAAKKVTKK